ncbi:efflux RND transporter permease subunit [Nonomuraea sp. NPDC050790]|uniref:efflux RND transporter permease subunit n=1 Tax=Nonomuraea sp. NPDC050790 TaxID=3364371 RepID=UPI0037B979B1
MAAGLAVLPLVIMGDLPGHEIERPPAVVVLGGLVTSTLLSLFVTPPLRQTTQAGRRAYGSGVSSGCGWSRVLTGVPQLWGNGREMGG